MRRDARTYEAPERARIQGYHEGGFFGNSESYAYRGFKSNKYFTSDRFIKCDENFNRIDGKPMRGWGTEIEAEAFNGIRDASVLAEVLEKIVFPCFPDDLFKMQRDGSLNDVSAECITQVMTREFIRNNYANWKKLFDVYFPAFGISASRSGNCGMHVNISRGCFGRDAKTQADAVKKLLYLVNKNFSFFCALTNRNEARTCYCSRMYQYASKDACKSADLSNFQTNHGICFNLGHWDAGRIELRFVGGQSNFPCFRNTMESLFFIVERVKTLSWDALDDLGKVFEGCNQYVYDRIRSKCAGHGISDEDVARIRETVIREELL